MILARNCRPYYGYSNWYFGHHRLKDDSGVRGTDLLKRFQPFEASMTRKLLFLVLLMFGDATTCLAQSTETYLLVVPPSATVAGSGCACDGACGQADSTWLNAGSYATEDDCSTAMPLAAVTVTDATGATSTNDCSQTAQCIPGPPLQ
jgi:hypothetical protein